MSSIKKVFNDIWAKFQTLVKKEEIVIGLLSIEIKNFF